MAVSLFPAKAGLAEMAGKVKLAKISMPIRVFTVFSNLGDGWMEVAKVDEEGSSN
jgi:hypothetical protein